MAYRPYSPDQTDVLAKTYLQRGAISCPLCKAPLKDPKRIPIGSRPSPDTLIFHCPACDGLGQFEAPEPADPWSSEELLRITEEEHRRGEATCPRDGCFLVIKKAGSIPWAHLECPYCARRWGGDLATVRPK